MSQDPYQPLPVQPGYPQQPFSGAPAGYYPPAPLPPKRRKKWPWILGGIALVMILGCAGMFTLIVGGSKAVVDNGNGKNAVTGKLGTAATDGKFQFTVSGMKCGVDSVGPSGFGQKAQGQFCLIDVRVKNVSKAADIFNDSSQKGYDAAGTEYSVDTGAGLYANEEYSTFLEQINPGNTVHGKLVFDVPAHTALTSVVLHESMFTPGVKIPLK